MWFYLVEDERVDTGAARKHDERETDGDREDEAQLDGLREDGGSEVHEYVTRDLLITEGDVAKVTHLQERSFHVILTV